MNLRTKLLTSALALGALTGGGFASAAHAAGPTSVSDLLADPPVQIVDQPPQVSIPIGKIDPCVINPSLPGCGPTITIPGNGPIIPIDPCLLSPSLPGCGPTITIPGDGPIIPIDPCVLKPSTCDTPADPGDPGDHAEPTDPGDEPYGTDDLGSDDVDVPVRGNPRFTG